MKKRTISKLKSIFGSKKGKRQLQPEQSSKSSRSPSPEPAGAASPVPGLNGDSFRPLLRTPPPTRAGPPPSPPVPTHPVAPVAPEPSAPLPLMPCAVCGRTFVPHSLVKHVKICEKMTVKKRKTFDSSRQRREGTDLEQYLPKNFGLPENSPFLEKSPPNTAKPTPKPKPQYIRNAITKPMAELQRCSHCNRAFGVRAFERHVEWCADKAKILPAAPAQPPQHIADAKQRLNARTQYKAPPVRGRRFSQSRDKSSHSRSASVDSSRGVSPPPPREYGDYKHGRTRASESVSSNDCHDETSPHMPVIRNSRNSQNSSSGDANVKARQARLARDLSSSRKKQEPRPPSIHKSNTDTNIKKIQKSNPEPNKKTHKSIPDSNIKKIHQNNPDPNIKKIQQNNPDPNIKKIQQNNPDPNIKKIQQNNPDPNIKKIQQHHPETNIKKIQQNHFDTNIKKMQQNHPDTNIKKIQQNTLDPNIRKNVSQNKSQMKLNAKKQQQLKKLEEIASKYSQNSQESKEEAKRIKNSQDKSQIPVTNKLNMKKVKKQNNFEFDKLLGEDIEEIDSPKVKTDKIQTTSQVSLASKKNRTDTDKKIKCKTRKDTIKVNREISMSLDSLEECPPTSGSDRNCHSIGINTELLCVPCVIHDNPDLKKTSKKNKNNIKEKKSAREPDNNICEPKVELLYKNPTMLNSVELQVKDKYERESYVKLNLINSNFDHSVVTPSTSGNLLSDEIESTTDLNSQMLEPDLNLQIEEEVENKISNINITESIRDSASEKIDEENHCLSKEHFVENYEHDISAELFNESIGNKFDDENIVVGHEIECRHGSGETYTKFIEDPADLEEFMNLTDKLMNNEHTEQEFSSVAKDIDSFHTPKTNSIEAINKQTLDEDNTGPPKHHFSDAFEELKNNLRDLLEGAGDTMTDVVKKTDEINKDKISKDMCDANRQICDMEHITVYERKFYENNFDEKKTSCDETLSYKLPSITESNKPGTKVECNNKRIQKLYKPSRKYKMLGEQTRTNKEYQTFIVKQNLNENSDDQSVSSDVPPFKLPRIENKRLDDNYDPFVSAARQMKELMSSDTNIPKKIQTTKDHSRTLPALQPAKDKGPSSYLRSDNSKMIKDTLNKTYQKTPTLQRMKSFGSTNNENSSGNTFGGRCSSFRLNRNDKKPSPKLNTTFTKSSKENISTVEKNYFHRNSNLNRSFSSYTASSYSTPKPKDKIPKIATSMYHSFQRTTIKQPVKLDKIKRDDEKKDFVNLDAILADDNSSMTDSNYIDPRLINENDNLPINVNTILNNPDIISSMESLLTTENLPKKFESFSTVNQINNKTFNNNIADVNNKTTINEPNNNISKTNPTPDDLSIQYDKIMYSLEQSIASKTSTRDDDSLCEDFDLEEFMTSFDEEIHKHKSENKRTCSSTTRIVKQSELADSNRASELNSISSSPKVINSMTPVNKSMSLNFSSNNVVSENLFPSSVKRSTSLLDSIQKKNTLKLESGKSRHKSDQLEQDIMQSLKDFDKFYESEKNENQSNKEFTNYNGTAKRDSRVKSDRKTKKNENVVNGNYTPNGKASNDSAYSSLNRISPSKLSLCTSKEPNGLTSLEQIPAGSDSSGSHKEDVRSISSDEFLAMERSAELDEPLPPPEVPYKEQESHINEKRVRSRASSRGSPSWRAQGSLSSSGSEASLQRRRETAPAPRLSRFCHECGNKFPVDSAKFCMECGVKRLVV